MSDYILRRLKRLGADKALIRKAKTLKEDEYSYIRLFRYLKSHPRLTVKEVTAKISSIHNNLRFLRCMGQFPPDFEGAEELIAQGLDINDVDEIFGAVAACTVIGYPYFAEGFTCEHFPEGDECRFCTSCNPCFDSAFMVDIMEFIIKKGFDPSLYGGKQGAYVLNALCMEGPNHAIIPTAKLLLDAGADPTVVIFDELWNENMSPLGSAETVYNIRHSMARFECLNTLLYKIYEAKAAGQPYNGMDWWRSAKGQRIRGVYSGAADPQHAFFLAPGSNTEPDNCFTHPIVLDCESTALVITDQTECYTDTNALKSCPTDLSEEYHFLVGRQISDIKFSYSYEYRNDMPYSQFSFCVFLDDGSRINITEHGTYLEEGFCSCFNVLPPES